MPKPYRSTSWLQLLVVLVQLLSYWPLAVICPLGSDSTSSGLTAGESNVIGVLTSRFGTAVETEKTRGKHGEQAGISLSPTPLDSDSRRTWQMKRPQYENEKIRGKSAISSPRDSVVTRSTMAKTLQNNSGNFKILEAFTGLHAFNPDQVSIEGESSTNMRQAQRLSQHYPYKGGTYPTVHWQSKKRRCTRDPMKVVAEQSVIHGPSTKLQSLQTQESIPDLNTPYEVTETFSPQAEPTPRLKDLEVMTTQEGTFDETTAEKSLRLSIRNKSHQLLTLPPTSRIDNNDRVYGDGTLKTTSTENNVEIHNNHSNYYQFRIREVPLAVRTEANHRARAIVQASAALGKVELENLGLVDANGDFLIQLASRWPIAMEASVEALSHDELSLLSDQRRSEISLAIQGALYKINEIHDTFSPPLYINDDGLREAQKEAFEVFQKYWNKILKEKSSILSPSTDVSLSVSAPIKKRKFAMIKASSDQLVPLSEEHVFGWKFLYEQVKLKNPPHPSYRNQLVWALIEDWMKQKEGRILKLLAYRWDRKSCRFINIIDDSLISSASGLKYDNVMSEFNFKLKNRYKIRHPKDQGGSRWANSKKARRLLGIVKSSRGFVKKAKPKRPARSPAISKKKEN